MNTNSLKIAIIGLGYVGLPLAIEFSKKRRILGFDINKNRINELDARIDKTLEITRAQLTKAKKLKFSYKKKDLIDANFFIITVPTPVGKNKKPDLRLLISACKTVGNVLKKQDVIVIESTVFPGCTEEVCVPVLEKFSGLKFNIDFFCGYSPERVNPGDKKFTIPKIKKITSGSTPTIAKLIDKIYNEIITAGTHRVTSIKIAEAAKVIENTQRDLNIGLINELSIIFNKMNLDTEEILKAAETKWNFLSFRPGLVGGHCIGVDPYYLTYKSKKIGYRPNIILSARKLNDKMSDYIVSQLLKAMSERFIKIEKSKILIMGLTFKENCPDLRNSGTYRIVKKLKKYKCDLHLYDPWAKNDDIKNLYKIAPTNLLKRNTYDAILLVVGHNQFKNMNIKFIKSLGKKKSIIYDLKYIFSKQETDLRL